MEETPLLKEGVFVKVIQKVIEGKKERLVPFTGKLIKIKGAASNQMITVQNALEGVLVERIFPISSPTITKIEVLVEKKQSKKQQRKANRKKR
ncbi:MAG: 50S ribosomal protein L19 [Candidatus Levyibacteriota bacterium]